MHKTLLLCFIHGFKGNDETFGTFPQHLAVLIGNALPTIEVKPVIYPKFETRGDLKECVGRFRDWLQNKVIDLEVANETPSPTVDPSVRVILVGHSMGGIVAADTFIAIASESPLPYSATSVPFPSATTNSSATSTNVPPVSRPSDEPPPHVAMFPYIQGILAFDTPYLGISPSVVAHGAEAKYETASSAYSALSSAASVFGIGTAATASSSAQKERRPVGQLTAGPEAAKEALSASANAAAAPAWQSWGRYAMVAGAAGAVAAGGAAAYLNRDAISSGWSWSTSHLEFVGALMRGEELKTRVSALASAQSDRGTGFRNFYTVLGAKASKAGTTIAGGFLEIGGKEGTERTFCNLPRRPEWKDLFVATRNDKATDEVEAHMCMFLPRDNPGFYALAEQAKEDVVDWVTRNWTEGDIMKDNAVESKESSHATMDL